MRQTPRNSSLFYFKDKTGQKTTTRGGERPLEVTSALVPIPLSTGLTTFGSFMKHYSLTDYEVSDIGEGKFKYSIEIEVNVIPLCLSFYSSVLFCKKPLPH